MSFRMRRSLLLAASFVTLIVLPLAAAAAPPAGEIDPSAMRDYLRRERVSTEAEVRRLRHELDNWDRVNIAVARRQFPDDPDAADKRLATMLPRKEKLAARLARLESGEEIHPPPLPTGTRGMRRGLLGSLGNAKCNFIHLIDDKSAVFARYERPSPADDYAEVERYILRDIKARGFAEAAASKRDWPGFSYTNFDTETWVFHVAGKQRLDPINTDDKPRMVWVLDRVKIADLKQAFAAQERGDDAAGEVGTGDPARNP